MWDEDSGDEDGGAEHHQIVLESQNNGFRWGQKENQIRIGDEKGRRDGDGKRRTPSGRARDAVVDAGKLLFNGVGDELVQLRRHHWREVSLPLSRPFACSLAPPGPRASVEKVTHGRAIVYSARSLRLAFSLLLELINGFN